ncbi:MAG: hypothetical protein FWE48_01260 [Coriobacteriia bacterium]|nr:hypothetical protein [Coriobacteriia bacterium]MCL2870245.1 hypothetical protein [Coriobacteriia bacterium]
MRKGLTKFALILSLALVMSLGVAIPALADPGTPPMTTTLTKNLVMPDGVTVPAGGMTFNFNFAAQGSAPAIANQSVTIPAGSVGTTATATLNLLPVLEPLTATTGLNAGYYDWIVTEVVPTPNPSAAGVTYDTSSFRLRVHFANVAPTPPNTEYTLRVAAVEVFTITPGSPANTYTKTLDGLVFTNYFNPTTDPNFPALRVGKTITNRENANLSTLFTFDLALSAPATGVPSGSNIADLPAPLTGTIMNADGPVAGADLAGRTNPVAFTAGEATFQLRDGEWLEIPVLPAGSTYTLTESAADEFAPSVIVTVGGTSRAAQTPTPVGGTTVGLPLTIDPVGVIGNVGANSAEFTNAHAFVPPAGLVMDNLPLLAIIVGAALLALLAASRNRRRIEEVPVA